MKTLNKEEMIRDFVLESQDRFVLAEDIYHSFDSIIDNMLEDVLKKIVDYLNESRDLQLEFIKCARQANYFFYELKVNKDYFLRIENYYYFKTCFLLICGIGNGNGFDGKNMQHVAIRKNLKTEFQKAQTSETWNIARLGFDTYESNYQNNVDLYQVFKDKKLLDRLSSDFNDKFGTTIKQVVEIVLGT